MFYKNHVYKEGFFDYEKHGFGPVCYNYEDTVDTLIKANNMTSFNKVYEFCLFLDHINNNKGYDYGGKTR